MQQPSPAENSDPAAAAAEVEEEEEVESEEFKILWKKIEVVLEEYALSPFALIAAKKWVKMMGDTARLGRVREWLLNKVNGKTPKAAPLQKGCVDIVPGLRAQPWWDCNEFPWVAKLEESFPIIRDELLALRGTNHFQPFRQPNWASNIPSPDNIGSLSHDKGSWNVFYLWLHDADFEENRSLCPKTVELIQSITGARNYTHALFSALTPGSHVIPHHGPTNKKLRVHIALSGVPGSKIRVGEETRPWEEGKVLIFDDSFEHEVWHNGENTRFILIFDIWHPDLTLDEIKFLGFLQRSKMRAEKRLTSCDETNDNFYHLLSLTKGLITDDQWWMATQSATADQ